MKKLRISKIWIAVIVVVIAAVAAWALSGDKNEEQINFKEEKASQEPAKQRYRHRNHRGCNLRDRRYAGERYRQQTIRGLQFASEEGTGHRRTRQDQPAQRAEYRQG